MRKLYLASLMILLVCSAVMAQQTPQPQPLTFFYDYKVNAGKEVDFMQLIKTVGAPVRDKLMAEGVVQAWGMETPVLRYPGGTTHLIWFSVANWDGVEKVLSAMEAQQSKLAMEESKVSSARARQHGAITTAQRIRDTIDSSKTRDWLTRDLVAGYSNTPPGAGVLPITRYNFVKVKQGKGADYRRAWEKYNKPVFDKLIADGALLAYGLAAEEVKTDGDFSHFVWMATSNMAGLDKIGAAFAADRAKRTEDELNTISELFSSVLEQDKSRSLVTKSRIFKIVPMK